MSAPRSVRFEPRVFRRLASYAARHPGLSSSSVASRLVDEGLRMEDHPGIVFRDGPAGRRAVLIAGPDVWEVIRAVRSARAVEPGPAEAELLDLVSANTGLLPVMLRAAITYRAEYPDEIDALVENADVVEKEQAEGAQRTRELFQA